MGWKNIFWIGLFAQSAFLVTSNPNLDDLVQFSVDSTLPAQITSLVRTIDVAGTITREHSIVHLKRTKQEQQIFYLPIEPHRASHISSMEIYEGDRRITEVKNRRNLKLDAKGYDSKRGLHIIEVEWPHPKKDEAVVSIEYLLLGQTIPKPDRLAQNEGPLQGLYWQGDLLAGFGTLPSAFTDAAEVKVKVKTPTPRVFQKQAPSGFNVQQASGANLVIFTNKLNASKLSDEPQNAYVHYFQPFPLMVIGNLTRVVEVSHWGNNVAIEDQIHLENRGPKLKGPFSRAVHNTALYVRTPGSTAHILTGLTLELPQGAKDPYYVDTIGNVSTSRFRPSMPSNAALIKKQPSKIKKTKEAKSSKLELTPRYPIAGGWNYSFTIGYNLEAGRLLKQLAQNQYLLKIPFFTNAVDVPVESATLRVRLPEGAFNIDLVTPFPPTEIRDDLIDKTYLDTLGRPTIVIKKLRCTEQHAADIYISYSRPPVMSLQKPLAVASWMMALFLLSAGFRRFEWKIGYN